MSNSPTSINRRHFLGQTAIAGAVTLASAQSIQAANRASRKVTVGVMGLQRGRALAVGFANLADVEIKYCCDADINRAEHGAAEIGKIAKAPEAVQDYRRMLDDKSLDLVVVAAPNHWHAPATILACNAGKHVYCEKPCSHNPWEGETMIAAARKANTAVQIGTQRRSGPTMQEAIQKLHEGAIGRVYEAQCWYTNQRGSIGVGKTAAPPKELDYNLWQGPAPRMPYTDNRIHYNWHWFWHWGNGELGNNGIHTLDICRWGLQVDFPTHVVSSGGRYHFEDDQQTPDTQTVAYTFDGRKSITWQGRSCNRHPLRKGEFVTFFGDKGTMEVDSNGAYTVYDLRDKQLEHVEAPNRGDREHMQNIVDAIRSDKPQALNAEVSEGHRSTLLCHLGNIAQRTGRALSCDASNGHILEDQEAQAMWKRDYESGWEPTI
ncbi:MAG: Gfo/Idh/MocA family oxidoreductase [Planctomycetales bacterium]|nr:Gfo/Idh/MocA family oxidoreductase [Planctomycetales bacterium]